MRRLFPLFSALACLLLWGMLPAQGASVAWHKAQGGKMGEKLSALPLADLDGESQTSGLDVHDGARDLKAEALEAAFFVASATLLQEPVRLCDCRATTLVGIVVLVI